MVTEITGAETMQLTEDNDVDAAGPRDTPAIGQGADAVGFTPPPWEYIPSNEHHGPYVTNMWGAGDICDCYAMTNPSALSVRNGGDSKPIHFQHEAADANARLIAAAPEMFEALRLLLADIKDYAAWQRPCHAVDVAEAAIRKATGGQ